MNTPRYVAIVCNTSKKNMAKMVRNIYKQYIGLYLTSVHNNMICPFMQIYGCLTNSKLIILLIFQTERQIYSKTDIVKGSKLRTDRRNEKKTKTNHVYVFSNTSPVFMIAQSDCFVAMLDDNAALYWFSELVYGNSSIL